MIVDREEEIRAFKPEEYWSLDAKFLTPSTRRVFAAAFYGNEQGKIKIENKEQADAILSQLDGAQYRVKQSKGHTPQKPGPALYHIHPATGGVAAHGLPGPPDDESGAGAL